MWRTIIVSSEEKLTTKDKWLVIENFEKRVEVPIEDVYCVLIDNFKSVMSVQSLTTLAENGTHVIFCNQKHLPVAVALPLNTHYKPFSVLQTQINLSQALKEEIWKKIVQAKIKNQANVVLFNTGDTGVFNRMNELASEVLDGDPGNREGIAAKMFFKTLFGGEFIRQTDDGINSALNFGYSIIRSAVSKSLTAFGFNCALGVHHINEQNPFNLTDDLMEPFRPIVDRWVDENHLDITNALSPIQKKELIDLLNKSVLFEKKVMKARNAIDAYVKSFSSCVNNKNVDDFKLPQIIRDESKEEE